MRIVDDALWEKVKTRQQQLAFEIARTDAGHALNRAHRQRFLLSGLLRCGVCGGGYTIAGKDRYACATRRSKGTCDNAITITRQQIEARVLSGLKDRLMAPDLVREFLNEFYAEVNRLQAGQLQETEAKRSRLIVVRRGITGIVSAIEDGNYNKSLTDRLGALEEELRQLEAAIDQAPANQTIRIHPGLSIVYAEKVAHLEEALNDASIKEEAASILRGLIDRIELSPCEDGDGLDARLHGDLAHIMALCDGVGHDSNNLPRTGVQGSQVSVVAGARNQRYLHLDYAAF